MAAPGTVEWLMEILSQDDLTSMDQASAGLKAFSDTVSAALPDLQEMATEATGSSLKNSALNAFGVKPWDRMRRALRGKREESIEARDKQSLVDGRTPRRE
jgi:hypothetical protein